MQGTTSWSAPTWANPHVPPYANEVERARLDERAFYEQLGGEFIGAGGRRCPVCGPVGECPREVMVLLEGQDMGECDACARPLVPSGEAVGTRVDDGTWNIVKIEVRPLVPQPHRV